MEMVFIHLQRSKVRTSGEGDDSHSVRFPEKDTCVCTWPRGTLGAGDCAAALPHKDKDIASVTRASKDRHWCLGLSRPALGDMTGTW
ncbi:hypothetical protein HAX54_049853, partial [Datura stramonium]|nr:hypothetical protein [Datura stramonium]